jgi:hypothetical protein
MLGNTLGKEKTKKSNPAAPSPIGKKKLEPLVSIVDLG